MNTEPTTERIIVENYQSDQESYLLYLMHVATYKYSLPYIDGKKVLDYGCGSGYGSSLISKSCSQIIGVDVSNEAISHANKHFNAPNLSYLQIKRAEDAPLPFPDASFDVVLSFQVIEHVENVPAYLREIERVLVPGGYILIATPDRSSRLFSFQKPWNMWHLREYSQEQFHRELSDYFLNVKVLQIGGERNILKIELNRTKKLKWILLPVTLPFIPEFARKSALRFIKLVNYSLFRRSRPSQDVNTGFDESVFSISDHEQVSVDLLAIANKKTVEDNL